jgi:hypothetical protein
MLREPSHKVGLPFWKCDTHCQMNQQVWQQLSALGVIFLVLYLGMRLLRHSRTRVSGASVKRRAQLMRRIMTLSLCRTDHVLHPAALILAVPTHKYPWVLVGTCEYLSELDLLQVLTVAQVFDSRLRVTCGYALVQIWVATSGTYIPMGTDLDHPRVHLCPALMHTSLGWTETHLGQQF